MEHENSTRAFDRAMGAQNDNISPLINNINETSQMDEDEKNIFSGDQLLSSTANPDANAPTAPATPTGIENDSTALDEILVTNEESQNNAPTMVIEKTSPIGTPKKDKEIISEMGPVEAEKQNSSGTT